MVQKDNNKNQLLVVSNEGKVELEFSFFADEFCLFFHTPHVVIKKEENESFYSSFETLLNQSYQFSHPYSYQDENTLVWLSDVSGDLEDPEEADRISRMILHREGDTLSFTLQRPFLEKIGVPVRDGAVAFSPAGNGCYTKNKETGKTLQNEMIECFWNCLESNKIKEKRGDSRE